MTATPQDIEVRQVLVHPAVWPHLAAWLEGRGLVLARIPDIEDDLPTYAMVPATPNTTPENAR